MKMKRIITLLISFSMILSIASFGVVSANDFNSQFKSEMDFLKTIGMIETDYDSTLVITKAEFAGMVVNALYPEVDFTWNSGDKAIFNDVPENHAQYSKIRALKELGVVKGDGFNNFHPEKQITLSEAVAMLINALGYTYHADALGGYPTGYYFIAKEIGMLKGINISLESSLNGGYAVKLIYNSLFTNLVEMVSIDSNGVNLKVNPDKNILSERFSIFEYTGVVVDDGIVSIEGESIGDAERGAIKNMSTGDSIKAFLNDVSLSSYIGQKVKAYIRNNEAEGRYEFIHIIPYDDSKNITVNASDIIDATDDFVEYEADKASSKTEKIKLSSNKPVVLFNGVKIINKTVKELIPEDGYVSFIENTGDSVYDLVIIYSFNYLSGNFSSYARNIVVDSVITEEGEEGISCLFNPSASIDLNEDEYIYTFIINGQYKKLEDVKPGVVVSVAEAPEKIDGKTYYMLAVSDKVYEGSVSSIGGAGEVYVSDNDYYELSSSITTIKSSFINTLKTGLDVSIFVDITGKAAYVKTENASSKNYAYIVKTAKKNQGDEYIVVKFFTKEGKMLTLPVSEKVTIDGISMAGKSLDEVIAAINERPSVASQLPGADPTGRPAIVTVSNDKITKIDTDTPNANLSGGAISKTYEQQSVIQYYEEDADSYDTLKAAFRSPRALAPSGTNKTIGGKYFMTSNTVIINVPEIDTYALKTYMSDYRPYGFETAYLRGNDFQPNLEMIKYYEAENEDENYKILKLSQMTSTYSMDTQAYDIDPDTGVAGLVIVRGRTDMYRSGTVSNSTPMSVFIKVSEAYDEELEKKVTKIHYYENGTAKSATIDLDSCYYPYKALILGCTDADTPHVYKDDNGNVVPVTVNPLANGDIIRVIQSAGKITHIERVRELSDFKTNSIYGFVGFSRGVTVPYATSTSGSRSNFPFNTPIVDEDDNYCYGTSNAIGTMYPIMIKGNVLQVACTQKYRTEFSSIDLDDWKTYTSPYSNTGNMDITVITIPEDGGEVTIEKGTVNDIITLNDVDNDKTKASVLMAKMSGLELTETFVINGIENLR